MLEKLRSWFSPWWLRLAVAGVVAGWVGYAVYALVNGPNSLLVGSFAGVFAMAVVWGRLHSFSGSGYRDRLEREAKEAIEAARAHNERVEYYRTYPLVDHTLCTACGWLGRFRSNAPTYTGTKVAGTAAAVGGTGIAVLGCGGSVLGIGLIIIGIPLLFLFGLGLIPIIIGTVILTVGGAATSAGATVASGGASVAAGASNAARQAADAPNQCPQCKNVGLIPALSPMGLHHFQNTPMLAQAAQVESDKVIGSLPSIIELSTLQDIGMPRMHASSEGPAPSA